MGGKYNPHRTQEVDDRELALVGELGRVLVEEPHQPLRGRVPLRLQELDHPGLALSHDEQPEQDPDVHGPDP